MTAIAFTLNCFLALLLLAGLMVGMRLERRLKGLRDTQAGFAQAALDLNGAIARAEHGLAAMRGALKEAEETLTERVDEARMAAKRLETAMQKAAAMPVMRTADEAVAIEPREPRAAAAPYRAAPNPAEPAMDDLPIRELLARLRGAVEGEGEVLPLRQRVEPAPTPRSRARIDDDLFDLDQPRRAGGAR